MDTKWKNAINEWYGHFKKVIEYVSGVLLIVIGLWFQEFTYVRNEVYRDKEIFTFYVTNVLIAVGILLILRKYMNVKYGGWIPKGERGYNEWKYEVSRQRKRLLLLFTVLTIPACLIDYVWGINFVLTITMLLQLVLTQIYLLRFMNHKLDKFMEQMDEINKQKLETALEIERQSLEKVSKSDQLRMDLITNVSHDLKTPITSTEIYSDNMYCYRIRQNLFENALKYSAKGTRVFVKSYIGENDTVCLEMTNTAGYPMDFEKEEILEKFARGDKARSTDGNGLGLAIVSSYAKALGGEFDIQIDCDQFKAYVTLQKN